MGKHIAILAALMTVICMIGWGCDNDSPTPTLDSTEGITIERNELDMSVGEKWRFSFSENTEGDGSGDAFGFYEYEIWEVKEASGSKLYTVSSKLELQESNACKPTTASGTQTVNTDATPISYKLDISVGSG
ncbi:MAG: hypothetical protein HOC20_08090 [Chloroflexi bacterium]|jgi:hypothetical protein|nr:hypothetical protein [Chloroflexota bacterium]